MNAYTLSNSLTLNEGISPISEQSGKKWSHKIADIDLLFFEGGIVTNLPMSLDKGGAAFYLTQGTYCNQLAVRESKEGEEIYLLIESRVDLTLNEHSNLIGLGQSSMLLTMKKIHNNQIKMVVGKQECFLQVVIGKRGHYKLILLKEV